MGADGELRDRQGRLDVLIDRRDLLETAREKNLPITIIEKDYVLGWLLFGFSGVTDLVLKGGTALSKFYFPQIWRLSEDLDFVFLGTDFKKVVTVLDKVFESVHENSGINFRLKSEYSNPEYLQLKIQYDAVIGKNWAKVDVTREKPIDRVVEKELQRVYSDYPGFSTKLETVEEILAQKLRAILERQKCRDYYDVWKLLELEIDLQHVRTLFERKCEFKDIEFAGSHQFFPADILEVLRPYWERELGRLLQPLPSLETVVSELKKKLQSVMV
ncbi:nucleotidyl transferase AbiEii/AbiGii toxin family protein [candidate division TA06 bacterium]|uniref:Nucleotidyl transferase AbiEii/AbiGii toxin family protein n=1 Tax=candidate division TA06 bacterium TaxID=2250710 RepID=A0A523UT27_UNCT6|nr:MAG: nucleotidyl transferase AbiEii/AbiGii toxin family protein [candidate division TA06 bacterium]